jgi:hypothetical protein
MVRNLLRKRVVGEYLFHDIHNQVIDTLLEFLPSSASAEYDEAWLVFSGASHVSDLTREEQDVLFRDSVVKLEKKGSGFVISKDLRKRIINFLGKKEAHPAKPTNYKSFDDVLKITDPYMRDVPTKDGNVSRKIQGYRNLNLMK